MDKKYIEALKKIVKGKVRANEKLAQRTTFKIGGPAALWVEPKDIKDLRKVVLFSRHNGLALAIIGSGSNLLVHDEGFEGIAAHLGASFFKKISARDSILTAGAGCVLSKAVRFASERGLGGMESLIGIPGTVGGAVYLNAGGAGNPIFRNIGSLVAAVKVMNYSGNVRTFKKEGLEFGYRSSSLDRFIILEVQFKLEKDSPVALKRQCSKFLKIKRQKQALDAPSAGCVFKNPHAVQFTCGQMIDTLGLKGRRMGGAEVSARHANFIINRGGASCKDVLNLIQLIKRKVSENYHVGLELEIKLLPWKTGRKKR